jgi:RND family efflux transporter MFP subunit
MTERSDTTANQSLTWCMTALMVCLALAIAGCNKEQGAPKDPRQGRGPGVSAVRIRTIKVQKMTVQRQVDLAGTLASPDLAKVSSETPGIVREVLIELGQEVKPGQVLVRLEPREMEIALTRALSQVKQTEAQLGINGESKEPPPDEEISAVRTAVANRDDARAQLARAKRLANQRLLPQADVDTAETRVKVMEAAYSAALENIRSLKATLQERRAAVELAQKKLNDTSIKAPIAGSVSERLVQPGEFIRENTPVVSLVQMHPLKIKTSVQERYASVIAQGLGVQFVVESFPGEQFIGKIGFISPSVDQTTRTFPIEILVDNLSRRLKPGFFAKGVIFTKTDEVIAVPEEAISTLAGVSNVFVIEQNKARQQPVALGTRQGKLVEITDGLKGSEVLASSNLSMLATGVMVEQAQSRQADLDQGVEPASGGTEAKPAKGSRENQAPGKEKTKEESSNLKAVPVSFNAGSLSSVPGGLS